MNDRNLKELADDTLEVRLEDGGLEEYKRELRIGQ